MAKRNGNWAVGVLKWVFGYGSSLIYATVLVVLLNGGWGWKAHGGSGNLWFWFAIGMLAYLVCQLTAVFNGSSNRNIVKDMRAIFDVAFSIIPGLVVLWFVAMAVTGKTVPSEANVKLMIATTFAVFIDVFGFSAITVKLARLTDEMNVH